MPRKRFTERQVLECLAWQGIFVTCFRCGKPFFVYNLGSLSQAIMAAAAGERVMHMVRKPEREHLHEHGLDGPDIPANCRYSCEDCHKVITNGTKATTAGSSRNRCAKANNKNRTEKFVVQKRAPGQPRPPSVWGSRRFPSGNRGFPPRGSRPLNKKRRA